MIRHARKALIPLIVALLASVNPSIGVLPLRDLWRASCQALESGDASNALVHFREFDSWYGKESAVREAAFNEARIRLWGLAALQSGQLEEATTLLERWLHENPEQQRYRAFMRFQLASLADSMGDTARAEEHRSLFLNEHPDLPECSLIRWRRADQAIAKRDYPMARQELQQILATPSLPQSGRPLARAALALVELATGNEMTALQLLGASANEATNGVLPFWRALVAPSLVQQLLATGQSKSALTAATWFDTPDNLASHMYDFCTRFAAITGSPQFHGQLRQTIWNHHWQQQLDRLHHSLTEQDSSATGSDTLYTLRLQSLMEANQLRQTALLGEALIQSSRIISSSLRAIAYRRTIEARLQLKEWDPAEALAMAFREAYPNDPALPDMRLLTARAAAGRSDWNSALRQVALLLEDYPDHPARQSWAVLRADWSLQAGKPAQALQVLTRLWDEAPTQWRPFLTFQRARAHESLGKFDVAETHYSEVTQMETASASLKEFAFTSLLKSHLRRFNDSAFAATLAAYKESFPDGMNQPIVQNLSGSWHLRREKIDTAVNLFTGVASQPGPAADFAREQLSSLYRKTHDWENLRRNAVDWIRPLLTAGEAIPEKPFLDAFSFQRETATPALPAALASSLMESLQSGSSAIPATPFLNLLGQQWTLYAESLRAKEKPFQKWVDSLVEEAERAERWTAYAAFQLFTAACLESAGRQDSADVRRIRILKEVDPALLGPEAAFIIARTARTYDFPEAGSHLSRHLEVFPDSPRRPDVLFLFAGLLRSDGRHEEARIRLQEVLREWPDAPVWRKSSLTLSQWLLEDLSPGPALAVLDQLLNSAGLPPETAAPALLLRAKADFLTGNPKRGFLNCFRILTLYPDLDDTAYNTCALILDERDRIPDPSDRTELTERLRKTAPEKLLASFHLDEA